MNDKENVFMLLWLEAPLQSWGFDSLFYRRDTALYPTKSGILGLLCCASGYGGEQREWLAHMASCTLDAYFFPRTKENIPLPLIDFHMVGSGYDTKDSWETLMIPKTIEGKPAVGGGVKLTYRYYIQDAAFAIILSVSSDEAKKLITALEQPVWNICLGRKNCIPTDIIPRGYFLTHSEALEYSKNIAKEKNRILHSALLDGNYDEEPADFSILEHYILHDVPVCFGNQKEYKDRRVTKVSYVKQE